MTVLNDLFDYGLKIYQDDEYFKFSIDSILLGEFIKVKKGYRILDLCTGNAPVPMILSTREQDLEVVGVEIQKEVFDLAKRTIDYNNLSDKITIVNGDAKTITSSKKFDIVSCNPPYFKVTDTSLKNENPIKGIARHEIAITLKDVIRLAKNNLKETGTFYMVHRIERFLETVRILEEEKFGIRNVVFVHTKKGNIAEFFLIEASKYKKSDLRVKSLCIAGTKTYKNIFEE